MKLLVTTSSFPVSDDDEVPSFVKDQVLEMKALHPEAEFIVHAPHNYYSDSVSKLQPRSEYKEYRYHYFWPHRWELLAGRGIMPALKKNKSLYLQIPFLVFSQFVSLFRLVRKEKPDLIYAHWFTPQAITTAFVAKLTRVPFMFTTHASDVIVLKKLPFSKHLVRYVCNNAGAYTAVAERTVGKLRQFFSDEDWANNFERKLSIIPMGVTTSLPVVGKKQLSRTTTEYKLPEDKLYIMFIGRLAEKKGVKYLIEAFSKLPPVISEQIHLIVAGDGQLRNGLQNLAEKLGVKNITFTGYVSGAAKDSLFELAHYMCFPSIIDSQNDSEGFPVVVMESLAAGKIVLASDVTGAETIINTRVDGFIFKQKSSNDLAELITKVIRLDPSEINKIEANSIKLAKQFDWKTIAKKHYEIIRQLSEEHAR